MTNSPETGLLVVPRIKVQNANCISSPMTWGFPAITAFTGLMTALERKTHGHIGLQFLSVGVICHHFEAQVTQGGYTRAFRLTRNPVDKDGSTAAIVEEGRAHLEITLVFGVAGQGMAADPQHYAQMAQYCADTLATMRVAGGSVLPAKPGTRAFYQKPQLVSLGDSAEARHKIFRTLSRQWLPGFALVCRDDLLQARLEELQQTNPAASRLDAWLDLSSLQIKPLQQQGTDKVQWQARRPPGWLVPIPVGFGALSDPYEPGQVANARDPRVPFRFVESLYSIGQWLSPHRLEGHQQLLWYPVTLPEQGLYRCLNEFTVETSHI
ncbi:MAG: type I-F CRISPR-associated protein Csy2 [Pseudomonadota bacterium]|uniref:type I-F CRISPR-associated protein Csy2 n=1 Tax=Gallaecimonas pentaromativorans TaxID=584787 RepID=UPI00067F65E6|nr:type I-F CRISPR-associated protein Csy2 [Gallaecimonas pentaromativorans]MED5526419.1 type I-F CRISPR-associated protein Csy2 [Pseudomonadota bacterium]